MSGGGGSTNTIQSSTPWSGEQPALSELYNQLLAAQSYGQLAPQLNTGQIAPFGSTLSSALQQLSTGNGATNGALDLTSLLSNGNWSSSPGASALQSIVNGQGAAAPAAAIANGNYASNYGMGNLDALGNGTGGPEPWLANIALNGQFGNSGVGQTLQNISNGNFNGAGLGTLNNYANGSMLNSANNAAQQLYSAESQPIMNQFNNSTLPQLLSSFSAAGRLGSGANALQLNNATQGLGTSLGNLSQSTIGSNYEQQIQNQLNAANTLSGLQSSAAGTLGNLQSGAATSLGQLMTGASNSLAQNQNSIISNLLGIQASGANNLANLQGSAITNQNSMGMQQLQNLLNSGQLQQGQAQNILNAGIAQSNYNTSLPIQAIQTYASLLQGLPNFGSTASSGSTSMNPNYASMLLGGGLLGSSLLGSLGGGATAAGIGAGTFALPASILASTAIPTAGTSALMGLGAMGALAL